MHASILARWRDCIAQQLPVHCACMQADIRELRTCYVCKPIFVSCVHVMYASNSMMQADIRELRTCYVCKPIFVSCVHVMYADVYMCMWVRILNDVQLAIFRPWALLLHLVRPQLLRNHFFWCRRKEYKQGFQETYTLYTFTHLCTSHGPPNAKKWQKVMFLHFFIFSEPSCKFSSYITDII